MPENSTPEPKAKRKQRGKGRPFQKGQSGNPGGRPLVLEEVRKLAASYSVEAMQTVYELMMKSPEDRTRLAAASLMLDRAFGKPSQAITGDDGGAIKIQHSGVEILAMLKKLAGETA